MPKISSIAFADNIIVDKNSGKISLIGIFSSILGKAEPVISNPWGVYFSIHDVIGKHTFRFEMIHVATDTPLFKIDGTLEANNFSNKNAEFSFMLPSTIEIPKFGVYRASVYLDGIFLDSHELLVDLIRIKT